MGKGKEGRCGGGGGGGRGGGGIGLYLAAPVEAVHLFDEGEFWEALDLAGGEGGEGEGGHAPKSGRMALLPLYRRHRLWCLFPMTLHISLS